MTATLVALAGAALLLVLARRPRVWAVLGLAGVLVATSIALRVVVFDSRRDPVPPARWVIAGLNWPQARELGARRVWVHRAFRQALWRLPP